MSHVLRLVSVQSHHTLDMSLALAAVVAAAVEMEEAAVEVEEAAEEAAVGAV